MLHVVHRCLRGHAGALVSNAGNATSSGLAYLRCRKLRIEMLVLWFEMPELRFEMPNMRELPMARFEMTDLRFEMAFGSPGAAILLSYFWIKATQCTASRGARLRTTILDWSTSWIPGVRRSLSCLLGLGFDV